MACSVQKVAQGGTVTVETKCRFRFGIFPLSYFKSGGWESVSASQSFQTSVIDSGTAYPSAFRSPPPSKSFCSPRPSIANSPSPLPFLLLPLFRPIPTTATTLPYCRIRHTNTPFRHHPSSCRFLTCPSPLPPPRKRPHRTPCPIHGSQAPGRKTQPPSTRSHQRHRPLRAAATPSQPRPPGACSRTFPAAPR